MRFVFLFLLTSPVWAQALVRSWSQDLPATKQETLEWATPLVLGDVQLEQASVWFDGKPIFAASVRSLKTPKGRLTLSELPPQLQPLTPIKAPSKTCVTDWLKSLQSDGFTAVPRSEPHAVWWPTPAGLTPAYAQIWQTGPFSAHRICFDASGILKAYPLQLGNQGQKVSVGQVFTPNPASSTQGAALRDNNDAREAVPESLYKIFNLAKLDPLTPVRLSGAYAQSSELSSPIVDLATSGENFLFFRDELGFEETNIYYHITRAQTYLQSLGILNLQNSPILFDAHALNGNDASQFSTWVGNQPVLEFGDGGVDDGEDGDLILHEYAHALHHALVGDRIYGYSENLALPAPQRTNETQAISESIADYWAYSLTYDWNQQQGSDPNLLMEWDSAGLRPSPDAEVFYLRRARTDRHYPEDLTGNPYEDSQLLTQALVEIRDGMPPGWLDTRLWLVLSLLPDSPLFHDVRDVFTRLDTFLDNGANRNRIDQAFAARGIQTLIATNIPLAGNLAQDRMSIGLVNPNPTPTTVYIYAVTEDGTGIGQQQLTLSPRGRVQFDLAFIGSIPAEMTHVRLLSTQTVVGFQESRSESGDEWALTRLGPSLNQLDLPHIATDTTAWVTQMRISHYQPLPLNLDLRQLGEVQAQIFDIPTQGSRLLTLPQALSTPLTWAEIHSQSQAPSVAAVEWFSRADGLHQRAALTLNQERSTSWVFPHIAADRATFWTGIALVNPQSEPNLLQLSLTNAAGETRATAEITLAAGEKWVGLIEKLFPDLPTDGAILWVQSQQPVFGYELFGTQNGESVAGLPAFTQGQTRWILPLATTTGTQFCGLVVTNLTETETHWQMAAFDAQGQSLQIIEGTAPARGRSLGLTSQLFSTQTLSDLRWVSLTSDQPTVAFALLGDLPGRLSLAALEAIAWP
ncbi:MAG: hypothetical protein KDC71_01845 [Acidobacteria bacterium]|nr:hypothetical protein [Acidobacteriota bacterium]